jgi:hypothetical protein
MTHEKKSHDYEKYRKNKKTKLPQLKIHHKNRVGSGDCRAVIRVRNIVLHLGGRLSRIQGFKACITAFGTCYNCRFYSHFNRHFDYNYLNINILNICNMAHTSLLFANRTYDTAKQSVEKNQIIQMNGYEDDRYVVYDIVSSQWGLSYKLINLRTKQFRECDLIRPLSQKFGIGYYFDDVNPKFMDALEVMKLHSEATYKAEEERKAQQRKQERAEQLKAIGRQRLEAILPDDVKAVIVAELRENESDTMTDYFGYSTQRTVIPGFSGHAKDLFSEMRKYAANFAETAHLADANPEYEHREKYTGGSGYYLGKNRYSGWIVTKEKCCRDRKDVIERYALTAGDEANICVPQVQEDATTVPDAVTGDFIIVDYSEKALAVFGDTKPVKDELKALGGRFNPKLMHEGTKKTGWIFSKSKEQELKNLLNVK